MAERVEGAPARLRRLLSPESGGLAVACGVLLLGAWYGGREFGWAPANGFLALFGEVGGSDDDDAEARHQSYYEALLGAAEDEGGRAGGAVAFKNRLELDLRAIRGDRPGTLRPGVSVEIHGHALETNAFGMPDRERSLARAGKGIRIAWVGESWTSGWGVDRAERYPDRFAAFLDRRFGPDAFEALNFSVPGNSPPVQLHGLRERVLPFSPDLVLLVSPPADARRVALDTARMLREGFVPDAEGVKAVLDGAGARPGRTVASLYRRLEPRASGLLAASIAEAKRLSEQAGAAFASVLLPVLEPSPRDATERRIVADACGEAGATLLDLSDAFDGEDRAALVLSSIDPHPDARAHALLERSFRRALSSAPDLLARVRLRAEDLAD